jgi:hypothetical protein
LRSGRLAALGDDADVATAMWEKEKRHDLARPSLAVEA